MLRGPLNPSPKTEGVAAGIAADDSEGARVGPRAGNTAVGMTGRSGDMTNEGNTASEGRAVVDMGRMGRSGDMMKVGVTESTGDMAVLVCIVRRVGTPRVFLGSV